MAFIKVKDLSYYYPDTSKPALDKVDLEVPAGQFVLIVGASGSGKSSLVRAIAGVIPDFYGGVYGGNVYLNNQDIRNMSRRAVTKTAGLLFQDPESQLVMSNVEQEIVFGMENLGLPNSLMKRRLMEVADALGLSDHLQRFIPELSGGQKQKVALASILAMQPEILLLDEPTSQLDPVAAEEILSIIKRLNEENGITVIMAEQRLERCFHLADRVLVMDKGQIVYDHHAPEAITYWALNNNCAFIPPLARLFASVKYPEIPTTVKQGRRILRSFSSISESNLKSLPSAGNKLVEIKEDQDQPVLEVKNLWFTFANGQEALKNVDLKLKPGEFTVIMGANGAGKTTLIKHISGLLKPGRGTVKVLGRDTRKLSAEELAPRVGYLAQDPNDYLFLPTVREELAFTLKNLHLPDNGIIQEMLSRLKLDCYQDVNPRDLSTGERQRVALASILVTRPQILLLDEPTRGLDYQLKKELGDMLLELQAQGTTIVVITHDVEFAAEYASAILLMSQGSIIEYGSKYDMLSGSTFYSPQINKLFHNIVNGVVTLEQGKEALNQLLKLNETRVVSV
jgi:energy-coupling factor transporter ATP-binding protein EcfA2